MFEEKFVFSHHFKCVFVTPFVETNSVNVIFVLLSWKKALTKLLQYSLSSLRAVDSGAYHFSGKNTASPWSPASAPVVPHHMTWGSGHLKQ